MATRTKRTLDLMVTANGGTIRQRLIGTSCKFINQKIGLLIKTTESNQAQAIFDNATT